MLFGELVAEVYDEIPKGYHKDMIKIDVFKMLYDAKYNAVENFVPSSSYSTSIVEIKERIFIVDETNTRGEGRGEENTKNLHGLLERAIEMNNSQMALQMMASNQQNMV